MAILRAMSGGANTGYASPLEDPIEVVHAQKKGLATHLKTVVTADSDLFTLQDQSGQVRRGSPSSRTGRNACTGAVPISQ